MTDPAAVKKSADNIKDNLKVYPLAKKDNPPKMEFKNMTGVHYNTVPPSDYSFFEVLNEVIQKEPLDFIGAETRGLIASIGIVKGKPFAPDARMKKLLTEAAAIGDGYARANTVYPRDPGARIYDENSEWVMGYADKDSFFLKDGARRIDARLWLHFNAICVTPAMALIKPGAGSDYGIAGMDSKHQPLDGAKTYKLHLPPNVPVKDNWSVTIYDTQTRAMLQTDQPAAGVNSLSGQVKPNADGSFDILFSPEAPEGKRRKLDPDDSRKELVHHPADVRPAGAMARQDLASERARAGGVIDHSESQAAAAGFLPPPVFAPEPFSQLNLSYPMKTEALTSVAIACSLAATSFAGAIYPPNRLGASRRPTRRPPSPISRTSGIRCSISAPSRPFCGPCRWSTSWACGAEPWRLVVATTSFSLGRPV